jgi:hypothetical protein
MSSSNQLAAPPGFPPLPTVLPTLQEEVILPAHEVSTTNQGSYFFSMRLLLKNDLRTKLQEWFSQNKSIDIHFKVLPFRSTDKSKPLLQVEDIPQSTMELTKYFPRLDNKVGESWGDVRVSYSLKPETALDLMSIWLSNHGHNQYLKALQEESDIPVGWLLYSTLEITRTKLTEELIKSIGVPVAVRYQNIYVGKIPQKNQVKALHVVSTIENMELVKEKLLLIYRTNAKEFPLDIRMRFIPAARRANPEKMEQFLRARRRQETFEKDVKARIFCWDIHSIDTEHQSITLRKAIMHLHPKAKPHHRLFLSVDPLYNNFTTFVFTCLVKYEDEARMVVADLLATLQTTFKLDFSFWFTASATGRLQQQEQDYVTEALDNESDASYYELDDDQNWEDQETEGLKTVPEMTRAEKIQAAYLQDGEDSLATFGPGASAMNTTITGISSITKPTTKQKTNRPPREKQPSMTVTFLSMFHQLQAKEMGNTPDLQKPPPISSVLATGTNPFHQTPTPSALSQDTTANEYSPTWSPTHQNPKNIDSQGTENMMDLKNASEGDETSQQIEQESQEVPDPLDDTMVEHDTADEDQDMNNYPEQLNQDSSFLSGSTNESLNITSNNSSILDSSLFQEKDL